MKNLYYLYNLTDILGVHWKIRLLGGSSQKKRYKGGGGIA